MLEKIFCNKWAIWFDAAWVTGGLLLVSSFIWNSPLFSTHWIGTLLIILTDSIIIPFLAVIWSLKGEVDGWN